MELVALMAWTGDQQTNIMMLDESQLIQMRDHLTGEDHLDIKVIITLGLIALRLGDLEKETANPIPKAFEGFLN